MPVLLLVGRVLFSAIFLAAAPRHFTAEAAAHATDLGVLAHQTAEHHAAIHRDLP